MSAVAPQHRIELAWRVRILRDSDVVSVTLKKSQAILAVLALSGGRAISRDRLAALLWSECDEHAARRSLRQTLHKLRRELGADSPSLIRADANEVALLDADIDIAEALLAARAGRIPELLKRDPEALLNAAASLDGVDPALDSWLIVQRQRLHEDAIVAFGDRLATCAPSDRHAVGIARILLRMEPTHEAACRTLMRAEVRLGNVAEALNLYNALWKRLDDEYDCLPSEETQALAVALKQANSAPALERRPPAANEPRLPSASAVRAPLGRERARPIIYVDRFRTSGLGDAALMRSTGLRLSLIAAFCRFREWQVIDGEDGPAPDRGCERELFVLSGDAVEQDGRAVVVLRFRSMGSSAVVWSERIDVEAGALERRAVRRSAAALSLHLSAGRLGHRLDRPERIIANSAHDAWFLGQALLNEWHTESEDQAEALFRRLVAEHPEFAPGYIGLAQVLNTRHIIRPGVRRSRNRQQEAIGHSQTAVRLDPLNAHAQLTMAWSFSLCASWNGAIEAFRLAVDLNDNDAWIVASSALGLAFCGDPIAPAVAENFADFGVCAAARHWAYLSALAYLCGDYESAIAAGERGVGANHFIDGWRCAALARAGRTEEGRTLLRHYLDGIKARWQGEPEPSDGDVMAWLLQCNPIRHEAARRSLGDGLRAAGAPIESLRFRTVA